MFRMYFVKRENKNISIYNMLCKSYVNKYDPTGAAREIRLFTGSYSDCSRLADAYAKHNNCCVYTSAV